MQKQRTGDYVADDYVDQRILHYDDLFYFLGEDPEISSRRARRRQGGAPGARRAPHCRLRQPKAGSGRESRKRLSPASAKGHAQEEALIVHRPVTDSRAR